MQYRLLYNSKDVGIILDDYEEKTVLSAIQKDILLHPERNEELYEVEI